MLHAAATFTNARAGPAATPLVSRPPAAGVSSGNTRPLSPETPQDGLPPAFEAQAQPCAPFTKVAPMAAPDAGEHGEHLVQFIDFRGAPSRSVEDDDGDEIEPSGRPGAPYVCGVCNKAFKKKSLMTAHERIHNDDRPYQCQECPKAFRDLGALNSHKIRLHSRELLKFSCTLCSKRFRYQRELDIHARMHTGDKPYQCGLCDKRFTQVGNHRSHVRRHLFRHCFKKAGTGTAADGTESGECLLCGSWLANLDEMNRHTKLHTCDEDVARLRQIKANVFWSREMPTGKRYKAPSEASQNVMQERKQGKASVASAAPMAGKENAAAPTYTARPAAPAGAHQDSAFQAAMALAALTNGGASSSLAANALAPPGAPPAAGGYYVFIPASQQ